MIQNLHSTIQKIENHQSSEPIKNKKEILVCFLKLMVNSISQKNLPLTNCIFKIRLKKPISEKYKKKKC
jgi:hypothetical protein